MEWDFLFDRNAMKGDICRTIAVPKQISGRIKTIYRHLLSRNKSQEESKPYIDTCCPRTNLRKNQNHISTLAVPEQISGRIKTIYRHLMFLNKSLEESKPYIDTCCPGTNLRKNQNHISTAAVPERI
jgi:hypothetical protein